MSSGGLPQPLDSDDGAGSDVTADRGYWYRFIDACQAHVGRLQLDGVTPVVFTSSVHAAAAPFRSRAGRLLAHSVILRLTSRLNRVETALAGERELSGPQHVEAGPPPVTSDTIDPRVRSVLEHISAGASRQAPRLRDLASSLRVSPSHLSRLVVRETGVAFHRHVARGRMTRSARLLAGSRLSVKEIASAAGYDHVPSFDRQFRCHFRMTPTQFRLPPEGVNLEDVERQLLTQALERAGGNQTQAAHLLGINRDQVRYRLEKFGLKA